MAASSESLRKQTMEVEVKGGLEHTRLTARFGLHVAFSFRSRPGHYS